MNRVDMLVRDCFHGRRERECETCPAYQDKCCFGESHQYGDEDCDNCIHEDECSQVTHGYRRAPSRSSVQASRPRSSIVNLRRGTSSSTATQSGQRRVIVRKQQSSKSISIPSRSSRPLQSQPDIVNRTTALAPQEEPFAKRLGKITLWGMIMGGLQMILDFVEGNRPNV